MKKVLTFQEACIYTGIAESYMYRLTSERRIPHYKPNGKTIYFDREDLDKWCLSNPCLTKEEIEKQAATIVAMSIKTICSNQKGQKKVVA